MLMQLFLFPLALQLQLQNMDSSGYFLKQRDLSGKTDNSGSPKDKVWQALTLPVAWRSFLKKLEITWVFTNFLKEIKKSGSTVEGSTYDTSVIQDKTS